MSIAATGIFQYENDGDLIEGTVLHVGPTPQAAAASVEAEMQRLSPTLPGFSITEVLPGNPFGLATS